MPEVFWTERLKPELALEELRQVMQAGVRFGEVLDDASYGISASFRQGLSALGLKWLQAFRAFGRCIRRMYSRSWLQSRAEDRVRP